MEMERPKSKEKKKKRHQNSVSEELSSSIESLNCADDLEELRRLCESESIDNEAAEVIEVQEATQVEAMIDEPIEEEEECYETNEEAVVLQVPSAPITMTEPIITTPQVASNFIYPDLTEVREEESTEEIEQNMTTMTLMKPFDAEVMEQFYSNEEIQHIEMFEKEFIDNELRDSNVDHFLYVLLKKFSNARFEMISNGKDIETLVKRLEDHYRAIWKIENRIALASGFCSCGRAVGSTHGFKQATFCDKTYQELEHNLKMLQMQVCYNQSKLSHECSLYQHQIEQIIAEIINSQQFKHVTEMSPITLHNGVESVELRAKINDLRVYISILFKFLREVPHDAMIEESVRGWIKQLISLQLRVATWHDHIFILFHMLRCKDGFGSFGSCFIQIPTSSIDMERSFQHSFAVLSTILMPITKRIQFLEENLKDVIPSLDTDKSEKDLWILVESDGEDSSSDDYSTLKENDLVAIFDQIPLDVMFKAITYADNDSFEVDCGKFKTGHHIIKSIAFASKLITIIKRGLFNLTERHRQFAKRLGKLLKDTLFYIRDLVLIYEKSEGFKDPDENLRIHIEFDELIIRSVWVIYDSKKFSLFQYLADFPYEQVSRISSLWKLCYSLHVGELRNVHEDFSFTSLPNEFFTKFNHYDIPMDDLIFLLHAFSKIAIAKGKDHDFLLFVVRELIHIGFIIGATRDFCYTTVKNSITDIATEYPKIIDDIFNIIKFNLHQIGAFNLHLLKALPLQLWRPDQKDFFDKIRNWLLNFDFESLENITARLLIRSLNWNFDSENASQLFLPHEFHIAMAHLICEIYMKFVDETKEESKFLGVISRKPTKMENISKWCWTTTSLLRLHQMDISKTEFMFNPSVLVNVPELDELKMIYQGYTENKSLAIYMSILISQLGHSLPQLCHYGFKQLTALVNENRYLKVIECLELMTPLFVTCQESLFSCENFMNILEIMVKSESEQDRLLRDLKQNDQHAKHSVLNYFGYMIQNQMNAYQKYGWTSPCEIASLWVNCLTRVKNWNKEKGATYLLDIICQSAYPYVNCWCVIKEIIRPSVTQIAVTKIAKSTGWLGLVMSGERDILISPFSECPTLSLIILECEHENIEVNTGAWDALINQLAVETKKSFTSTFKSVLQSRELTQFPPRALVVFKLAELVISTSVSEAVFPIICQQFFSLYLSRSSLVGVSNEGIQSKFNEIDSDLFKKLKNKLQECENFHIAMAKKFNKDDKLQFHTICANIFKTFLLWTDESQMSRLLQQRGAVLPPQYEAVKLTLIFERNRSHWTEFINLVDLRTKLKANCDQWLKVRLRFPFNVSSRGGMLRNAADDDEESVELIAKRISDRLKLSIKLHKPPPEFVRKPLLMGKIDLSKSTVQLFKTELKKIKQYAQQFSLMTKEHLAVDATYLDCIRFAYKNEPTFKIKTVQCSRGLDDCRASIPLRFEFNEMKVNEVVRTKLNENREYKKKIVSRELKDVNSRVTGAHFCLEIIIQQLLEMYRDASKSEKVRELSTSIVFEMLDDMNEEIRECPVAYDFYSFSISKLGSFVQAHNNKEGVKMLKKVLKNPNTLNVFAKLFEPASTPPAIFIKLYECLVDFYIKNYEAQLVFLLLSKFDMPTWLELHEPKLIDVSELIQLIFKGLELYSLENSELLQDILKRHLVHLFLYHFPEHYGEILHTILQGFSQNRLRPCVLLDVINALFQRVGCRHLEPDTPPELVRDEIRAFASKQNLLCYDDLHSTTLMLNHHFYNERLNHGLHGIYPKYSVYCDALAILFGAIGHGVISAAIKTFCETTADQLVNDLFACLSNMYAPMLVPIFYSKNMKTARPALWIQQLTTENTVLQPWSNLQAENAEKFIKSFSQCLSYLSDMLPASNSLIGNVCQWYIECYAHTTTPNHVLLPIHKLLVKMPFERLLPTRSHMEGYNRILSVYLPDCHTFLGNVFLRINWTQWLTLQIEQGDVHSLQRLLAILLMTLVKLSYEPKVRESIRILQLLKESIKYPWQLLEYKDVENVLDWIVMSAEPSIILNIPSEHESIDVSLLTLLQTASCMRLTQKEAEKYQQSVVVAKRMAYVRSIVRLLKACDAKLHQLVSSKKGKQMFIDALCSLLDLVQSCVQERPVEATNLVITITDNVLTQTSSEDSLNLFASAIQTWQERCVAGDTMIGSFLDALKLQSYWTVQGHQILETTLRNFFKRADSAPCHNPTWIDASERTGMQLQFSVQQLIDNDLLLTLHLLSFKKLAQSTSDNDRMEYLQELQTKLASKKTTEATEASLCLVWVLIISSYARILSRSDTARGYLETINTHFQGTLNQSESWGDGLLNAVGLKKDSETNAKKVLIRCFAIVIQILLTKNEQEKSLSDLNSLLNQKKFADVKMRGLQAATLIEGSKSRMSDDFADVTAKLIRVFFSNDFLHSIERLYSW